MNIKNISITLFALFLFQSTVYAQNDPGAVYFRVANQYYKYKDYLNAYRYYTAVIKLNPNSAVAYQRQANCLYYLGYKAEALNSYEKALQTNPDNPALADFVQRMKSQMNAVSIKGVAEAQTIKRKWNAFELSLSSNYPIILFSGSQTTANGGTTTVVSDNYSGSFFGSVFAGFRVTDVSLTGLAYDHYAFKGGLNLSQTTSSTTQSDVGSLDSIDDFMVGTKFYFNKGDFTPIFFFNFGISVLNFSGVFHKATPTGTTDSTTLSSISPLIQLGLGLQYNFSDNLSIFLDAKSSTAFLLTGMSSIPQADASSFGSAGIFSFVPVEAGFVIGI